MAHRKLTPVHPGEVLFEDYLEPLGLSQYRLAGERTHHAPLEPARSQLIC